MLTCFYDIESLQNVFTLANFRPNENLIELYYLLDSKELVQQVTPDTFAKEVTDRIHARNRNFTGTVALYDLEDPEATKRLARTFGLSDARYINDKRKKSNYPEEFRLVCDTDPEYDENKHPYLFGYNSYNYDTTMLALYFREVIKPKTGDFYPTTAAIMRRYNNELFTDRFKGNMSDYLKYTPKSPGVFGAASSGYSGPDFNATGAIIRKNMLMSGRHIDVARLNEKQQHVGLKRILGMLGYQILESDKLRPGQDVIETYEQLLDLLAYNVSDVVNLDKLFKHKTYQSAFLLKRQMLKTYPELVYDQGYDTDGKKSYKPDVRPTKVRTDRLTIDSSSAQLSTKALCPYEYLHDYDTVSFVYPCEAKAKELGIPQINVLEESRKFFYANFPQPELRERFDAIYNWYKSIEGRNFNGGKAYLKDHGVDPDDESSELPEELKVTKFSDIPAPNTCIPYFYKDGTPSSCFVNFSTGGIHGAEYNKALWEMDLAQYAEDMKAYEYKLDVFRRVMQTYPNPCDLKIAKGIEIDGVKYRPSEFLKPKATKESAFYKELSTIKKPKEPQLFVQSISEATGSVTYNLAKRYTYTSAAMTNHEDFTSYYPNMLRMMGAFWNDGLGYDRYGEVFDNKTEYGHKMKDKSLPQAERDLYSVMRNGTKLILNSASGAADANFENNIKMNNRIISMRIIGQLFTWRIGQAQTLEGASIISTNTDGLYSVLEKEHNNEVLARESESIHVEIEPEPMFLISKDSNNRAEIEVVKDPESGKIDLTTVTNASGGTLSCREGPTPTQSLAHAAILDWAMTEYLIMVSVGYKGNTMSSPFNRELGMSILRSARKEFNDDVHTLIMFQNVLASSPGSQRYIFATRDDRPEEPIPLQHYNRAFMVKAGTPGAMHLKAASAKVITTAMQSKREKMGERPQQHDPVAAEILAVNDLQTKDIPLNKEATVTKIPGVDETWNILIDNRDLHMMDQEDIDFILDSLDYENYLALLSDSFEKNWRNVTPESIMAERAAEEAEAQAASTPVTLFDDAAESAAPADTAMPENPFISTEEESCEQTEETVTAEPEQSPQAHVVQPSEIFQMVGEKYPSVKLNRTVLTPTDIRNGEQVLEYNSIRIGDSHRVLRELLLKVTNTDIDT